MRFLNYVDAVEYGLKRLKTLPVSRALLCEVDAVLMRDVRGGEPSKTPGEFRRSQDWIGGSSGVEPETPSTSSTISSGHRVSRAEGARQVLDTSQPTALSLVDAFVDGGILREVTGKKRNRCFFFAGYLALFPEAEATS